MRILTAVRGMLIALILALFLSPVASAASQETLYLGPDGFPIGSLVTSPRGGEMPNFDLGRDTQPGLRLERSALGLAEVEETRFQQWQVEMSGEHVFGYPSVVIWSAPADFVRGAEGVFSVFILDCSQSGGTCAELGAAEVTVDYEGGAWAESSIDLPEIDHRFEQGRYLALRIVVSDRSDSDLMLAYGYPKQRSRFTISAEPPVLLAETTVRFEPESPADTTMNLERMRQLTSMQTFPGGDPDGGGTVWLWAVPLALSTLVLIGLGAFLLSGLTKPGKHERRVVTRRLSMSAR